MTSKNKTLIIGGGHPQYSLIESFSAMGKTCTIIDDRHNIPAFRTNNDIVKINRYDLKRVLDFAEKMRPSFVSSGGSDKAVHIMALVAEKLGIHSYVPSKVAELPMKKGVTRRLLQQHKLPVPKSYEGSSLHDFYEIDWDEIVFPVVVKPDEGIGQTGVDKAATKQEAIESINHAFLISQNGKVLLQEFIEGPEIGINGIVLDGEFRLLTTSYRRSSRARGGAFGVAMMKAYPAITDQKQLFEIQRIINQACQAMGVVNAPIYAQIIMNENFGPFIIEIMPRLGGGEDPRLVHHATGFDISKATAILSMGEKPSIEDLTDQESKSAVILRFIKSPTGTINGIDGILEASKINGIEKVDLFFTKGDYVGDLKTSRERAGYILTSANSVDNAMDIAERGINLINIRTD